MIGGERYFAGKKVSGKIGPIRMSVLTDAMQMLAVSAIIYETGKNLFGVDMSKGLALGPMDMMGGSEAMTQKSFPMFVPPVLSVGWNAAQYLAPGIVPGGLAISRALGTMPQSDTLMALGMQKTYADWDKAQSGMVPVYDSEGRYMGEYPTSDVVLRAFGADMGRFNNPHELSQFLVKNRDAMRDMRRQFIAATLGNNVGAAMGVKSAFEKKFGMAMTVTQAQFKEAIRAREESVVQRTMNTLDKDVRGQYVQAVQQYLPGQLMRSPTPVVQQGAMYQWGNRS